jgi:copper chaperone NosL
MSKLGRIFLAIASCLTLGALATPLWRIQLFAPQYPEGLGMKIHAGSVRGTAENDLHSINSLNHYIGMKAIEPEEIAELRVIPWFIAGLAAVGFLAAAVGRRRLTIAWLASYAVLGAVGMWDFRHWEFEYGHDLDYAHAIIKVPGMSYEPPLIGSKQLLNFTASSWPDIGTLLIGAAVLLALASLFVGTRPRRAIRIVAAPETSPRERLA